MTLLIIAAEPAATAPEWLAYASAGVSLVSALVAVLFGLHNRATSKAALEISQRQEARRESRFDIYINHTAAWGTAETADRVLGVNVQVTNPTERETSITRAELHLTYAVEGRLATVKVLSGEPPPTIPLREVDPLSLPHRLEANEAKSGWLLFLIPAGVLAGRAVDRYDLVLRDLHEIEQSLQVAIFPRAQV